jgi:hypothetical protein
MKQLSTLFFLLIAFFAGEAQSETHNFVTYDTTISIAPCSICAPDRWNVRISRPVNMFKAGDADTASRPAIITMPGQGELGVNDLSKLGVYGPHYWLNNGWDGGVTLGNGKHYPILITVCYLNNVYPTAPAYYNVLSYLLKTYHIKKNSVHLAGLSQGAFSAGALILYEATAGDETGMKLVTTVTCFEGTPDPLPLPYSLWSRGFTAYQVWAKKYGGRYFYLEGNGADNFRDGWQYADAMNAAVPGSAYFSYEKLGGGAHCCWNDMYNPNTTNWTSVGTLGPNNAPSQVGTNQMGDYKAPSSVFQWMMKHGDTSLVGSGTAAKPIPTANAGTDQTITLPTSSVTLSGSGTESGGTIKSYSWKMISGPTQYTFSNTAIVNPVISNLAAGTYVCQLTVTDNNGTTATDQVTITVNALPANAGNPPTVYLTVPGTIEAESYGSMIGIATEATTDAGGGKDVGWLDAAGDQMTYNINVATAGVYTVSFRVASPYAGAAFQVQNALGSSLATVAVPNTSAWQVWTTVSATVTLPAGQQMLKIVSSNATGWNLNWMQLTLQAVVTGKAIPGTIQAEDYDNMTGIATEATTDASGGKDVGWIDAAGDLMSYNVNVATAGVYTVSFRVASVYTGAVFTLQNASGYSLATVTVPNTGGWQVWTTVTAAVTLPAGAQALKIVSSNAIGWNLNWTQFALQVVVTGKAIPGTIQAEDYDSMTGVAAETTMDAGGGKDVGYIDAAGDQMSYNVYVAAAGAYTVNFRVASPYSAAAFTLQNASGIALANLAVTYTSGWQVWTTMTGTVTLPAGQQTLKIVSSNAYGWNINWIQFVSKTAAAAATASATTEARSVVLDSSVPESAVSVEKFELYPNPATDNVLLDIANSHIGRMKVRVISTTGVEVRTYEVNKTLSAVQVPISVSGLPTGMYIIRVQGADWSETKKVLKK